MDRTSASTVLHLEVQVHNLPPTELLNMEATDYELRVGDKLTLKAAGEGFMVITRKA